MMESTTKKKVALISMAVLLIALAAVYYLFDPTEAVWMPRCIWKVLTGTDCPGCGSQRMAHALVHGDFAAAWRANAYALCMLPVIIFLLWLELTRESHPILYARVHRPYLIILLALSVIVWWLLRNML